MAANPAIRSLLPRIPLARGRYLDPSTGLLVMGIVNTTPDSFFAGSRRGGAVEARDAAVAMVAAGASIIDVGGESTRPGSEYVGLDEELERVLPAIAAIRAESDVAISVDTRKAEVARAALDAGADIVNDISAMAHDPAMCELVMRSGAPVILMHMLGDPKTMQEAPRYGDCAAEVRAFLRAAAARALAAGIGRERIILDPGIGFGKRLEDNIALLARLDELVAEGYPVLVGLSRKSFVGAITGKRTEGRLAGSVGAVCAAWCKGASVFRVHDVAETVDALAVLDAIAGRSP